MCYEIENNEKPSTFVTSDWHLGDTRVLELRYLTIDIEKYNNLIIKNINKTCKEKDTLYVLGDVGINNKTLLKSLIKKIKCKLILIKGNHDLLDNKEYIDIGFEKVYSSPIFYDKKVILSHFPIPVNNEYFINLHGHLHKEYLLEKNYFNVCVDVSKYCPINIKFLLRTKNNLKSVEKKFGKEWYFNKTNKGIESQNC